MTYSPTTLPGLSMMAAPTVRQRVSVFVDGANMFHTQKKGLGWFFDPAKLLVQLTGESELADAYWYMGIKQPAEARDENFVRFLVRAGYVMRIKNLRTMRDPTTGDFTQRASLDVEIVVDMFNTIDNYDRAIILSGSGNLGRALELLRSRGKEITVISTEGSVAADLRRTAGFHFVDLLDLRPLIERTN
jgi:uncharacterized LabA/DUF88 family protein